MVKMLQPYAWGIFNIQCDKDALANSSLRLLKLSAVFPDGEIVKAPEQDELPSPVDLNEIPLSQQAIIFYVAMPSFKHYGDNFSSGDGKNDNNSRYSQQDIETPDLYTQAVKAELTYLKKSIRIVSELEPRDNLVCVPLLRLVRLATGGFEIDPTYIPPSLTVSSSSLLTLQLKRLMDALQAKVNALHGHHREPSKHVIEFRSGDVSSFWLLHTASSAFASLSHYLHHPNLHPERLFEQLLGLAGSLMTYSKSNSLVDLPAYQHNNLGECFGELYIMIRKLLDTVISAKYFAIALTEPKPSYYHGMLDSGKVNENATLFIAVSASIPALELSKAVPLQFKIGAPDDVDKFVLSAMPGVKVVHAPQVPAAIPVRPDTLYFSLENKGHLYERMLQAQSISIYVPSGLADLKIELMAVSS